MSRPKQHREVRLLPLNSDQCHHFMIQEFTTPLEEKEFDHWYNRYMSQWGTVAIFIVSALKDPNQFKVHPNHDWSITTVTRIALVQLNDAERSKVVAGPTSYKFLDEILRHAPDLDLKQIPSHVLQTLNTQSKRDQVMFKMIKGLHGRGCNRDYIRTLLSDPQAIENFQKMGVEKGLSADQTDYLEALRKANEAM